MGEWRDDASSGDCSDKSISFLQNDSNLLGQKVYAPFKDDGERENELPRLLYHPGVIQNIFEDDKNCRIAIIQLERQIPTHPFRTLKAPIHEVIYAKSFLKKRAWIHVWQNTEHGTHELQHYVVKKDGWTDESPIPAFMVKNNSVVKPAVLINFADTMIIPVAAEVYFTGARKQAKDNAEAHGEDSAAERQMPSSNQEAEKPSRPGSPESRGDDQRSSYSETRSPDDRSMPFSPKAASEEGSSSSDERPPLQFSNEGCLITIPETNIETTRKLETARNEESILSTATDTISQPSTRKEGKRTDFWLVKVPLSLHQAWRRASDELVGRINLSEVADMKQFATYESTVSTSKPSDPKLYNIQLESSAPFSGMVYRYRKEESRSPRLMAIEPKNLAFSIDRQEYRRVREAEKNNAKRKNRTSCLEKVPLDSYGRLNCGVGMKDEAEEVRKEKKFCKPQEVVLKSFYDLFLKRDSYTSKELSDLTHQPVAYVEKLLPDVAELKCEPDSRKKLWFRKPEFFV